MLAGVSYSPELQAARIVQENTGADAAAVGWALAAESGGFRGSGSIEGL